ncbi:MAG: hypothetical protein GY809_20975 [Planctomycetes bacterium]|nr:hypothetical protein [Planctomycetota bacterium]
MKQNILLIAAILGLVGFGGQDIIQAEAEGSNLKWHTNLTTGLITEADTGLQFRKVCGIGGSKDVIEYNGAHISPNGKFLLSNNDIIPLENGDAFELVDFPAFSSSWSPDGRKIVFYSGGIWLIPMSPKTGRPTGPARKVVEGNNYWYKMRVQWTPDSDRFAFHSDDGQLHVFSIKDDSSVQVTDDNVFRVQGGWSPDGRRIAGTHNGSVWIVSANGGDPRKLVEKQTRVRPYWSLDGKWIFFQNSGKLQFVRVSDSAEFDMTLPEGVGEVISLSPDGELLFYKPSYEWSDTLKIISASGGEPITPARGRTLIATAQQWSPDAKFVVTGGMHEDKWNYWIVPIAGDEPYPLELDVPVEGELTQESLSPDLKKLLFSSRSLGGQMQYWIAPVSLITGKALGFITKVFDKGEIQFERWSLDGSKVIFLFEKDLWISRTDGSGAEQLTGAADREVVGRRHVCSPDGSAVSWISHSASTDMSVLRMRRFSEDRSRDIVETPKRVACEWSPDGSHIAYELYGPEDDAIRELFVMSTFDGELRKLMETRLDDYHSGFQYRWSPSGENLALLVGRKVMLFRFPGGKSQQIGDLIDPALGRSFDMSWSPDGQTIALTLEERPGQPNGKEPGTRVLTVTVPDGRWTELDGESGYNYWVNWSPDGKWLSYGAEEWVKIRPEGILWELELAAYLKQMDQKLTAP